MIEYFFWIYVAAISLTNLVALSNLIFPANIERVRSKKSISKLGKWPLVSVIVPMRNEESNVGNILHDLFNQTYKNMEVIAVDDDSDDTTPEILALYKNHRNFTSIRISKIAKNVNGKSNAISGGVQLAKGELLLFVDADLRILPETVENAVVALTDDRVDVLGCFPKIVSGSFGETLITPLMMWSNAGHLPYALVNRSMFLFPSFATSQFLMCSKNTYIKSGGHSNIKDKIEDGIGTIDLLKKAGAKYKIYISNNEIRCRMYSNYKAAEIGFSRSLLASYPNIFAFSCLIMFFELLYFLPFGLVLWDIKYLFIIIGIYLHRIVTSIIYKDKLLLNVLLHPLQMAVLGWVSLLSIYKTKTNNLRWKDRKIGTDCHRL